MNLDANVVYPGTFDPVTNGHVDILQRAASMFDKVTVLVANNPRKKCIFDVKERVKFVTQALANTETEHDIAVEVWNGFVSDYVKTKKCCRILRGLRALSDFEYEFQQAMINRSLGVETLFLPASGQHMYVSSSLVREFLTFGKSIESFVPSSIAADVTKQYQRLIPFGVE